MDIFSEFDDAVLGIKSLLSVCSEKINNTEKKMQAAKLSLPFSLKIEELSGGECSWFIAWELDSSSKSFRLLLIKDNNISHKPVFKRPLIECNVETRAKVYPYIELFIEEFTFYIKSRRKDLEKIISGLSGAFD